MSKPEKKYRKKSIGKHELTAESLVIGYGYDPHMSEGSIKPPIFMTSTFAFKSAADGEKLFAAMAGKIDGVEPDLIYTRFNNPSMEVLEDRLTLFDGAEEGLVFSSGMGAITTSLMACAPAGSTILQTSPLYGASEVFIRTMMPAWGVQSFEVDSWASEDEMLSAAREAAAAGPLAVIYTESPANPTNALVDIEAAARVRDKIAEETGHSPVLMCDNTMMGPVGHKPLKAGADVALYSLTKYVGGHSDLIAGGAVGDTEIIQKIRKMRNYMGSTLDAHTCWLLTRSLETVELRMQKAFANAKVCAEFLQNHPKVENVRYLSFLAQDDPQRKIFESQCEGAGSTFSFDLKGGKPAAFALLDSVRVIKLAVSLGGTESLMCHPGSTTHSSVPEEVRKKIGFTDGLVRLSIGIENADDLVEDLRQALENV